MKFYLIIKKDNYMICMEMKNFKIFNKEKQDTKDLEEINFMEIKLIYPTYFKILDLREMGVLSDLILEINIENNNNDNNKKKKKK